MASSQTPSKEVQDWENKFRACMSARQVFEEQWYYNLAFYFGRQYAVWDKGVTANRLIEPPAPRNRVRLVSNKIKPYIRREIAKLTKSEPQFFCVPATTEPMDISAARAAENIALFALESGDFNAVRRRATWWASLCGTSFIKTYCTGLDENIIYEPISPFHIFVPNLQEETLRAQPFVYHAKAVTPEKVYDTYGIELKPDTEVTGTTLEQRFFNAMGIKTNSAETQKNLVYLKELWINPCKNYPKGGFLVIAGGKVVYAYDSQPVEDDPLNPRTITPSENPWDHNDSPFVKIDHIPTGRFYGDSIIVDLIPLQKEYNRSRSQIIESKNRTAKPVLIYQKGSLDPTKVTSEPGLMIPINPGFEKPTYLVQPEMPSYVMQELPRVVEDMDDAATQGATAKGNTPPGIEAASAIAYLQEQNDDILNHTVFSIEQAVQKIGQLTLELVQQFWTEEKLIKVVSKNGAQEVRLFKATDIRGNTDIRVQAGSMAPRSRAAKQAFITDLMKNGFISPEKGLRYLEMNETDRLYEELQIDSRHAQRENLKMAQEMQPPGQMEIMAAELQGIPLPPFSLPINEFDNDEIHIQEVTMYMKSQEYELLEPMRQQLFMDHYLQHKQRLENAQLQQQLAGLPPDQEGENVGVP
jgi:hypothetical protein